MFPAWTDAERMPPPEAKKRKNEAGRKKISINNSFIASYKT